MESPTIIIDWYWPSIDMIDGAFLSLSFLDTFLFFFPRSLWDIFVDETNDSLEKEDAYPMSC